MTCVIAITLLCYHIFLDCQCPLLIDNFYILLHFLLECGYHIIVTCYYKLNVCIITNLLLSIIYHHYIIIIISSLHHYYVIVTIGEWCNNENSYVLSNESRSWWGITLYLQALLNQLSSWFIYLPSQQTMIWFNIRFS